jgi:hypothetical protein
MKRYGVFAILTLFVLSSATFNQFVKLPVFFHHYLEHAQLDQDWSISNFVSRHYDKIEHSDDQHGDHERLPFKMTSQIGISITIPQSIVLFSFCQIQLELDNHQVFETQSAPLQGTQSGVWRPPIA